MCLYQVYQITHSKSPLTIRFHQNQSCANSIVILSANQRSKSRGNKRNTNFQQWALLNQANTSYAKNHTCATSSKTEKTRVQTKFTGTIAIKRHLIIIFLKIKKKIYRYTNKRLYKNTFAIKKTCFTPFHLISRNRKKKKRMHIKSHSS